MAVRTLDGSHWTLLLFPNSLLPVSSPTCLFDEAPRLSSPFSPPVALVALPQVCGTAALAQPCPSSLPDAGGAASVSPSPRCLPPRPPAQPSPAPAPSPPAPAPARPRRLPIGPARSAAPPGRRPLRDAAPEAALPRGGGSGGGLKLCAPLGGEGALTWAPLHGLRRRARRGRGTARRPPELLRGRAQVTMRGIRARPPRASGSR